MVKSEIQFDQLRAAIKKLPAKERFRLLEEFQREFAKQRLGKTLKRLDAHLKKNPISQEEIDAAVKETQREYYAHRRPRH